jgi:molecular chaperone DnaK
MGKIIGIDLGTTNSVAAVMSGGEPIVIPSAEGERLVPSVVAVNKNHERLVGRVARNQAITNPQNTIFSVKRFMGRKADDVQVEHTKKRVPYAVNAAENGDVRVSLDGKDYSPPEVSAMILAKMKADAESWRTGYAGRHHSACIFQRCAAQCHQGCRQDRRSGSFAYHQ